MRCLLASRKRSCRWCSKWRRLSLRSPLPRFVVRSGAVSAAHIPAYVGIRCFVPVGSKVPFVFWLRAGAQGWGAPCRSGIFPLSTAREIENQGKRCLSEKYVLLNAHKLGKGDVRSPVNEKKLVIRTFLFHVPQLWQELQELSWFVERFQRLASKPTNLYFSPCFTLARFPYKLAKILSTIMIPANDGPLDSFLKTTPCRIVSKTVPGGVCSFMDLFLVFFFLQLRGRENRTEGEHRNGKQTRSLLNVTKASALTTLVWISVLLPNVSSRMCFFFTHKLSFCVQQKTESLLDFSLLSPYVRFFSRYMHRPPPLSSPQFISHKSPPRGWLFFFFYLLFEGLNTKTAKYRYDNDSVLHWTKRSYGLEQQPLLIVLLRGRHRLDTVAPQTWKTWLCIAFSYL